MTCGVYAIKNKISERVYIGSSANIERRWQLHRNHLRAGTHHSRILQSSWIKHGEEAFAFEILVVVSADLLIDYEQLLIDGLKPSFNIHPRARNALGVKRSAETKLKLSLAKRGKPNPKLSLARKGVPNPKLSLAKRGVQPPQLAEYSRQCIGRPAPWVSEAGRRRKGLPGRAQSPETIAKISAAKKGIPNLKNRGLKKPWVSERNRLGRGKLLPFANRKLKLTTAAVLAIRADHRKQRVIAAEHGISQAVVSEIKSGKAWRRALPADDGGT